MKFEIWSNGKSFFWHLKARNGEVLCHSEAYSRKAAAMRAISLVRTANRDTPIEEIER